MRDHPVHHVHPGGITLPREPDAGEGGHQGSVLYRLFTSPRPTHHRLRQETPAPASSVSQPDPGGCVLRTHGASRPRYWHGGSDGFVVFMLFLSNVYSRIHYTMGTAGLDHGSSSPSLIATYTLMRSSPSDQTHPPVFVSRPCLPMRHRTESSPPSSRTRTCPRRRPG